MTTREGASGISQAPRTGSVEQRLRALEELAEPVLEIGAREVLVVCLSDQDKRVQKRAAEILARYTTDEWVCSLLDELIASSEPRARWGAAFALARQGRVTLPVIGVWLDFLGSDDSDLRWSAHQLLTHHWPPGSAEADQALIRAVRSEDPIRARLALYCVRDLGDVSVECAAIVRAALGAPEIGTRLAALAAYPVIVAGLDEIEGLLPVLEDRDPRVSRAATATLAKILESERAEFSLRDSVVAERVRQVLARMGRSNDSGLRRVAARALSALGAHGG